MSKLVPGNSKHLTLTDRYYIENALNTGISIKEMAKYLCKDPTSISREIKKRRFMQASLSDRPHNQCALVKECTRKNVCNMNIKCRKECRHCNYCNRKCPDFVPDDCYKRTHKAPYVCNGCPNKRACKKDKQYYNAKLAHNSYKDKLVSSREGVNMTVEEMERLNDLISPKIMRGQSINHIYWSNRKDIPISKVTLYRYIEECKFDARNIDLTRKVKYKKRRQKILLNKEILIKARKNRTYDDFNSFIENNQCDIVEMDTVMGTVDSTKSLLTLYFRSCKLMLAFVLEEHTANEVCEVFDYLEMTLGPELFRKTFRVLLTDNGTEFSNPDGIETSADGSKRTRLFYCNPSSPHQKGGIEKNHEFIRYVLPKGTSFDFLTQSKVNLLMNHINSLRRESLNGHAPYDIATAFIDTTVLKKLHLKRIKDNDILLKPSLLTK